MVDEKLKKKRLIKTELAIPENLTVQSDSIQKKILMFNFAIRNDINSRDQSIFSSSSSFNHLFKFTNQSENIDNVISE